MYGVNGSGLCWSGELARLRKFHVPWVVSTSAREVARHLIPTRAGRILYSLCLALTVRYDLEQGSSLGTRNFESISRLASDNAHVTITDVSINQAAA
jgi:hypothetical protein